jgi:hypothetical protein
MLSINCSICGFCNNYSGQPHKHCVNCCGFLRSNQEKKEEKKKRAVPQSWDCPNCLHLNGNVITCIGCRANRPPNTLRWECKCGHSESHLIDKCTGCFKHSQNEMKCPICGISSDNIAYDCATLNIVPKCDNRDCKLPVRNSRLFLVTLLIGSPLQDPVALAQDPVALAQDPVALAEADKKEKRVKDAKIRKELRIDGAFQKFEKEVKEFDQSVLNAVCSICQENLTSDECTTLYGHGKCWFHKDCFANYCDNEQFKNGFKCPLCSEFDFVENL